MAILSNDYHPKTRFKENFESRIPHFEWNTSADFALFCDFPISPSEQCCFVVKKNWDDRMICNSAVMLGQ